MSTDAPGTVAQVTGATCPTCARVTVNGSPLDALVAAANHTADAVDTHSPAGCEFLGDAASRRIADDSHFSAVAAVIAPTPLNSPYSTPPTDQGATT